MGLGRGGGGLWVTTANKVEQEGGIRHRRVVSWQNILSWCGTDNRLVLSQKLHSWVIDVREESVRLCVRPSCCKHMVVPDCVYLCESDRVLLVRTCA